MKSVRAFAVILLLGAVAAPLFAQGVQTGTIRGVAGSTPASPNKASSVDNLGLPTGYTPSSTFGTATGNTVTNLNNGNINAFSLSFAGGQAGGRTILLAMGLRF